MSTSSNYSPRLQDLEESLEECRQLFDLGLSTSITKAIDKLKDKSDNSIYFACTEAMLLDINSVMTMDKDVSELSMVKADKLIDMCDDILKDRPKSWGYFWKPNYNHFTDEQAHALLTRAFGTFIYGTNLLISDSKLMALVKAAFKIKSAWNMLMECTDIMIEKKNWSSQLSKSYFIDMLQLIDSSIVLVVSHLPESIMKFLSWFGFKCDQDRALDIMCLLSEQGTSVSRTSAKIGVCMYESTFVPAFGIRQPNSSKVLDIADKELYSCNECSWALLFRAMALKQMSDFDDAIDYYNRCLNTNKDLKHFHNLCHWDLIFCYGLKMEWDKAGHHADQLYKECNWSKATFIYMKGAFLYMKMIDENKPELKQEISEMFRQVPQMKQRFAGKTIPPEKYVCVNAEKYFRQNESLPLPAFDLFYIWNAYSLANNKPETLDPIIARVDTALEQLLKCNMDNHFEKSAIDSVPYDKLEDYCTLLLTKGVCLKFQAKYDQAEFCFMKILKNESKLTNTNLVAMASLEMGLTKIIAGLDTEAEQWLKQTLNYRKYFFKMLIHFRVHSALQRLKQLQDRVVLEHV